MKENCNLLNKNRIDLVIGIEYVEFYENNYKTDFFINLFIEHKRAFNGLHEGECKGKEAHLERFNNIIEGIKDTQTNIKKIPVYNYKNEYWVIDGFHRTSTLIYFNLKKNLEIQKHNKPTDHCYYPTNIYFFKQRNFETKFCNYTIYTFLKRYLKKFSCIILFPNNKKLSKDLFDLIDKNIIYDINIPLNHLNNNFFNNFIQLLYYEEKWCQLGGYKEKAKACKNGNNLKIYFLEKQNLNILNTYKQKVRKYYNQANHSIHIPDTQKEAESILPLLNSNTISFMDKTKSLYIDFPNFKRYYQKLKEFLLTNNLDSRKVCITGSSVLSLYGIRDCNDMDLFVDKDYIKIFKDSIFSSHNKYTEKSFYSKHFEEIIYNPDNHFFYQDIKFCTLNLILDSKVNRVRNNYFSPASIKKDKKDIHDINLVLKSSFKYFKKIKKRKLLLHYKLSNIFFRIYKFIKRVLFSFR